MKGFAAINPRTVPHSALYYLKKGLAFFDLRAKIIPPAVFVITFALSFAYYFMQGRLPSGTGLGIGGAAESAPALPGAQLPILAALLLACSLLLNIASSVYLRAAIKEAKGEDCSAWECARFALKNAGKLFVAALLKNLAVVIGLFLLIVPGIMTALEYLFTECAIMDTGAKVRESFRCSRRLMSGRKMPVFQILLFCNLVMLMFVFTFLQFFANSNNMV
ncbi:MAG: hypothetical protein LBJ10_01920, partial [Clostridiales bacterium]|nr:hypothetical protein [Clostridiales bacterium]